MIGGCPVLERDCLLMTRGDGIPNRKHVCLLVADALRQYQQLAQTITSAKGAHFRPIISAHPEDVGEHPNAPDAGVQAAVALHAKLGLHRLIMQTAARYRPEGPVIPHP